MNKVTYDVYIQCSYLGKSIGETRFYKTIRSPQRKILTGINFINWENMDEMYAKYGDYLPFKYKHTITGKRKIVCENGLKFVEREKDQFSLLIKFFYELNGDEI